MICCHFQVHLDRSLRVAQIDPGCSAARSGVIQIDDEVLKIDGQDVEKQPISILTKIVPGRQGTNVTLTFRRFDYTQGQEYVYQVQLMRGSAEFIELVAQFKSMAKDQAKNVGRLRELEHEVQSNLGLMEGLTGKILQLEEELSCSKTSQASAEESIAQMKQVAAAALRDAELDSQERCKRAEEEVIARYEVGTYHLVFLSAALRILL